MREWHDSRLVLTVAAWSCCGWCAAQSWPASHLIRALPTPLPPPGLVWAGIYNPPCTAFPNILAPLHTHSGRDVYVWLGGSDAAQEGRFVWAESGADFTFTSWAGGQPDGRWVGKRCMLAPICVYGGLGQGARPGGECISCAMSYRIRAPARTHPPSVPYTKVA